MAILSWFRSKKVFLRRNAIDEFKEFTSSEAERLRSSDEAFDAQFYQHAVDLVLRKLERRVRTAS